MSESIVLDPSELTDRGEFDLTCWIGQEGVDWGDAQIAAYMSESRVGEYPVDYRVPNREVQVPLFLGNTQGTITAQQARAQIQEKVALFQREGGWLRRVTNAGGTVFADIVNATGHLTSTSGVMSRRGYDVEEASISLSLIPDFYGPATTLSDHTETTLPEITFTETIDGDYPGRVRMVIDEDDNEHQKSLMYCFRNQNYGTASTEAMAYEGEALDPVHGGSALAAAGRSGGSIMVNRNVLEEWSPAINLFPVGAGTTLLTHTGRYRVFASCEQTSDGDMWGRLVWGIGDFSNATTNAVVEIPDKGWGNFTIVDFGEVDLREAPVGTHGWLGKIETSVESLGGTGGTIGIDRVWFCNTDEAFGIVKGGTVLHANQSAELRTEGYYREIDTGTTYTEFPVYGDLPRIPPGTTEVMVKASRGEIGGTFLDSGVDDISVRLTYNPSWLFVGD